jgi:hypothetical protein
MITKEDCKQLYNYYSQIETTESIISDLEQFIKECEVNEPNIIDENYKSYGSIQICIPYFESGKFKNGGARVFNIRYDAALLVLKDHVDNLRKKAEELSRRLEKGGAE